MKNILITTEEFLLNDFPADFKVVKNPYGRKLSEQEADDLIQRHRPTGMIAGIEPLTRNTMARAPFLKVISRCGIGLDSVDLQAASELGIKVANTPDAPTPAVAELAVALMLAGLRKISVMDRQIRLGKWPRPMGFLLAGKTVGLIGCGRIGGYTAKLLKTFGCNVLGYDPYVKAASFCRLCALEELLRDSDIVSLHVPHTAENHHLLNRERIFAMQTGAMLVNTARGGLVDEEALYDALTRGHLSGAALDCFENEPYAGPLANLENVVLTAHVGSNAKEARLVMERQALENLVKEI
ncbi:MAG: phosphoglycerate dehydrogenase [Kiritimatiellae bacterium]|jgi:D-3-phosphoglycerate dehydrogenase|nr:phosphoglycerate dehydrogenase [Kiritimatiellia bacterium]